MYSILLFTVLFGSSTTKFMEMELIGTQQLNRTVHEILEFFPLTTAKFFFTFQQSYSSLKLTPLWLRHRGVDQARSIKKKNIQRCKKCHWVVTYDCFYCPFKALDTRECYLLSYFWKSCDIVPLIHCLQVLALMNASNNSCSPAIIDYTEFYNTALDHTDLMKVMQRL